MIHLLLFILRLFTDSARKGRNGRSQPKPVPRVRVYDPGRRQETWVTERELPPGIVRVRLPDLGMVWARTGEWNEGEGLRGPFPPAALEVVKEIKEELEEVRPRSLKEWEEELRRCARPEVEVARWLLITGVYTQCTRGRGLSPGARRDYYNVAYACSEMRREQVAGSVAAVEIRPKDVKEAVALYFKRRG